MLFLNKLWKGEIAPGEGRFHPNREYSAAKKNMERCDELLKSHLAPDDYKTFREYAEACFVACGVESCDNFVEGFRMGAQLMMDVLMDSPET